MNQIITSITVKGGAGDGSLVEYKSGVATRLGYQSSEGKIYIYEIFGEGASREMAVLIGYSIISIVYKSE